MDRYDKDPSVAFRVHLSGVDLLHAKVVRSGRNFLACVCCVCVIFFLPSPQLENVYEVYFSAGISDHEVVNTLVPHVCCRVRCCFVVKYNS